MWELLTMMSSWRFICILFAHQNVKITDTCNFFSSKFYSTDNEKFMNEIALELEQNETKNAIWEVEHEIEWWKDSEVFEILQISFWTIGAKISLHKVLRPLITSCHFSHVCSHYFVAVHVASSSFSLAWRSTLFFKVHQIANLLPFQGRQKLRKSITESIPTFPFNHLRCSLDGKIDQKHSMSTIKSNLFSSPFSMTIPAPVWAFNSKLTLYPLYYYRIWAFFSCPSDFNRRYRSIFDMHKQKSVGKQKKILWNWKKSREKKGWKFKTMKVIWEKFCWKSEQFKI